MGSISDFRQKRETILTAHLLLHLLCLHFQSPNLVPAGRVEQGGVEKVKDGH